MAQDSSLCALRNRMKRRGYRSIHISTFVDEGVKLCKISALEPLSNSIVVRVIDLIYVDRLLQFKKSK